jgi:hypothetical protein
VPDERRELPAAVGLVLVSEPGRCLPGTPVDDDRRVEEQPSPGLLVAEIDVVVLVGPELFVPAADRSRQRAEADILCRFLIIDSRGYAC